MLRDILTGIDGDTFDLGRVLWALGVLVLIVAGSAQAWGIILRLCGAATSLTLWSAAEWAVWAAAFSATLPAGAGAIYMKRKTEPGYVPTSPPPAAS